jgi:hypothetical protein
MKAEANFSHATPLVFDEKNYQLWAVKIKSYLETLDIWEVVEKDYDVSPLPNNPTIT